MCNLFYSGMSSIQTPSSVSSQTLQKPKLPARPPKSMESNVFNFGEARVREYLSSLSSSPSSDESEAGPSSKDNIILLSPVPKKKRESSDVECISEYNRDLEVSSFEQVNDRLPSVSDITSESKDQITEHSTGPMTRAKKRKLVLESSPESEKKPCTEVQVKRRHKHHHHHSKHHRHRQEKRQKRSETIVLE